MKELKYILPLVALIGCSVGFFFAISFPSSPQPTNNQAIHNGVNSNQIVVNIGNNWERVVINKTDLASFKNLTKSGSGIWFVSACHLYFFVSSDISNNATLGDLSNVTTSNVSSIIEFPNTVYSASPFDCVSAIWGGEEKLNINGNAAHNIIEQYNSEFGADLKLSG